MKEVQSRSASVKLQRGCLGLVTPKATEISERLITELYDSYMKTVLKNRSRTLCRRYYKQISYECLTDNLDEIFQTALHKADHIAKTNMIDIQGLHCEVHDDRVYEALLSLPKKQLIAVILWYWYDQSPREIAKYFNVTDRTIRNWHCMAIQVLRKKLRKV